MLTASALSAALATLSTRPSTDDVIARIASQTVHGTTLADRLVSASTSTYMVSRMFRLMNNTVAHEVQQIVLDLRAQGPLAYNLLRQSPVFTLHSTLNTYPFTADTFGTRITRVLVSQASPDFPSPLSEEVAQQVWSELKTHIVIDLQTRLETALFMAKSFSEALKTVFALISTVAERTLNIWVHSVMTTATGTALEGPPSQEVIRGDGVAFLFGATYEYNSNETEYNRMSATIGHYIAQHLCPDSDVVQSWRRLWTPVSIQAAVALEAVSAERPYSTAMRYTVSYADRSNVANVILLSELTYMLYIDYSQVLEQSSDPQLKLRTIIDLMRTHAFLHTIRTTRNIQEDEENPLYGVSVYPHTVQAHLSEYSSWPTVSARIRKALRDREQVENLLNQMRASIALGPDNLQTVRVEPDSTDTLMAEEWQPNELAVALNGDRRPEYLVRVADYERMLLHGTAENPFDRRDVQTVEVVRIVVE